MPSSTPWQGHDEESPPSPIVAIPPPASSSIVSLPSSSSPTAELAMPSSEVGMPDADANGSAGSRSSPHATTASKSDARTRANDPTAPCYPSGEVNWLRLQLPARAEDPPHPEHAQGEEAERHRCAHHHVDVGHAVKTPAKAAHEVHDGVEQRDRLPRRGQHLDRVEGAAEERQGRDHHQGDHLQLLESVG